MKNVFVIALIFFTGCSLAAQNKILPSTRPADLQVSYHYDGGMLYYMEDLTLSNDSCVYIKNDGGKKITKRFTLSTAEMDALYGILLSNKFDQIEAKVETGVYDRGGISISMDWNKSKRSVKVSDAQTSFVTANWRGEWQRVVAYMTNLIQTKPGNPIK